MLGQGLLVPPLQKAERPAGQFKAWPAPGLETRWSGSGRGKMRAQSLLSFSSWVGYVTTENIPTTWRGKDGAVQRRWGTGQEREPKGERGPEGLGGRHEGWGGGRWGWRSTEGAGAHRERQQSAFRERNPERDPNTVGATVCCGARGEGAKRAEPGRALSVCVRGRRRRVRGRRSWKGPGWPRA